MFILFKYKNSTYSFVEVRNFTQTLGEEVLSVKGK